MTFDLHAVNPQSVQVVEVALCSLYKITATIKMYANLFGSIIVIIIVVNKTSPQCICTENKGQARCIHINLSAMNARNNQRTGAPQTIDTGSEQILPANALPFHNVQRLKLLCDIRALQSGAFGNQNKLKDIDLGENVITTIPNDLFAPIPLLEKLNLSGNVLQSPTLDTFYALNNLKILDASHNQIDNLQLGALDEMNKLEKLYLSYNKIPTIELGVFDELKSLTVIDLSYNFMSKIVLGLFDQNEKLVEVNLAGNDFTGEIPLGTFDSLKMATVLNIKDCKINKLPLGLFDETKHLVKLDLSKNSIKELSVSIFDHIRDLQVLNLASCELSSLPAHLFGNNSKLESLDLSDNKLSTLPDGLFRLNEILSYLNLSHNSISQLPIKIFQYTNLTEIDISYNKFTTIEPELLNMEWLGKVHAQNNHITYLDDLTFATNTFPLKYLDLRNNQLVFIGEFFFDWVANLERMEIFGNPWNCRCLDDLLSILTKKFIDYSSTNYYQGKLPICVISELNVCNVDVKNLTYYYDVYKSGF